MAWRVVLRGVFVMTSSSPTVSPWPYSATMFTPPSSLSVIARKRPLITMYMESLTSSGLHRTWPAWTCIQSRDASMWRTKNPSSETETRCLERVGLTEWRQEGGEPLRECQEDDRTLLQQPFQSGMWKVSHTSVRLRLDVDVRGSVTQRCCSWSAKGSYRNSETPSHR